jgi:hypothetical protein
VGYPFALGASARVALGTDGFVSDMDEEAAVLREESAAHGEDRVTVARRIAAGRALAAERFQTDIEGNAAADIAEVRRTLPSIRAEAREAAAALWTRMRLPGAFDI